MLNLRGQVFRVMWLWLAILTRTFFTLFVPRLRISHIGCSLKYIWVILRVIKLLISVVLCNPMLLILNYSCITSILLTYHHVSGIFQMCYFIYLMQVIRSHNLSLILTLNWASIIGARSGLNRVKFGMRITRIY